MAISVRLEEKEWRVVRAALRRAQQEPATPIFRSLARDVERRVATQVECARTAAEVEADAQPGDFVEEDFT